MRRSITRTLTAIAAGVVALGMAFAGGATANATAPAKGQSSITINGNGQDLTNRTFEAYRVIDIRRGDGYRRERELHAGDRQHIQGSSPCHRPGSIAHGC